MPTKVFFASAEEVNKSLPAMNKHRVRYRLASFYYMKTRGEGVVEKILYDIPVKDPVFFIDSGAFSMVQEHHLKHARKDPKWWWKWVQDYVDAYCEFLSKHRKRLFCAAELDIDEAFMEEEIYNTVPEKWASGMEAWWNGEAEAYVPPPVVSWRKMIESAGVPVIQVWHDTRERDGWEDMCRNAVSRYCGVPSQAFDKAGAADVNRFMLPARKAGALVHGFGMTKPEWIKRFPWYSVDSTTWLDGSKYGTTIVFRGGRLRYYSADKKDIRKRLRRMYESWGIDWRKAEEGDAYVMDEANMVAWLQYAMHLYRLPANRDYWLTEVNGAEKDSLGLPYDEAGQMEEADEEMVAGIAEDFSEDGEDGGDDAEEGKEEPSGEARAVVRTKALPSGPNPKRAEVPQPELVGLLRCDNCVLADRCEFFEQGARCHYKFGGDFATPAGIVQVYTDLIRIQTERVQFATLQEKIDGGQLSKDLSQEIRSLESMIHGLKELVSAPQEEVEVKAKGPGAVSALLAAIAPQKRRGRKQIEGAEGAEGSP